jgi:hypothetical protein
MSNLMNQHSLFIAKNLINDAVIANAKFVQSREVACIWLWSDVVQIRGEPVDPLGDSMGNGFI